MSETAFRLDAIKLVIFKYCQHFWACSWGRNVALDLCADFLDVEQAAVAMLGHHMHNLWCHIDNDSCQLVFHHGNNKKNQSQIYTVHNCIVHCALICHSMHNVRKPWLTAVKRIRLDDPKCLLSNLKFTFLGVVNEDIGVNFSYNYVLFCFLASVHPC